ncbi:hypothetical protein Cgig2_007259 [Carnegiea gigantea]|uniref:Uncharacterized protein n=1 Tax=Carnegiea gigantea TaxID=171969 RepID=A0A9Q1KZR2_9CARY|nr:hypothetical protein Cgig2_007259 [Carnegiea gigantea]
MQSRKQTYRHSILPSTVQFHHENLRNMIILFSCALFMLVLPHMNPVSYLLGLGFMTSITFIFLVGVFMSSWLGASVLQLGEWFIKKMPLVSYIYYALKQISAAINPDQNSHAFKEVAIIKHPRVGEYALAFITSTVTLHSNLGEEELYSVYVPTNHLYLGDIFLVSSRDIMTPNLSVREGIGRMTANFLTGGVYIW